MRWFKPNLRSSLHAIFSGGGALAPTEDEIEVTIEDIRDAMLGLLAGADLHKHPVVARRIRYATDIQALWFLRGDLMAVLASAHGEGVARTEIAQVSEMFENSLPQGLRSRPSPLSASARD
ncbi:MAG: hypothetical protein ACAH21_09040 [Ramlibacter sp.]|nr:hypothetical protein [Ramlibacter sp.]